VIMDKCKYYLDGLCYSPSAVRVFGNPSSEPVVSNICLSEKHVECKYYVEDSGGKEIYKSIGIEFSKNYYPPVHVIACNMVSSCPYYRISRVSEEQEYCIAFCTLSERYITRSSVKKCIDYWRECPFYKIGAGVVG